MEFVRLSRDGDHAEIRLRRGKVNAINDQVVAELASCLEESADQPDVRAMVLTGHGAFFSFGFDVPQLLWYSTARFTDYLVHFTSLYRQLFTYPKPVVAAVNGHAVAGGCMLATACDARVMVDNHATIGLNEVGFGSTVFAGSVARLQYVVGPMFAQEMLYGGGLYSAREAHAMGLVDRVCPPEELGTSARDVAARLAERDPVAFTSIKTLARQPTVDAMIAGEERSIEEFVRIWYSDRTRANLASVVIREHQ